MKKLLVDTHVLLWWLDDPALLSVAARNHHRDPFDRMLVAQALVENATLVTRDANILQYPTTCWGPKDHLFAVLPLRRTPERRFPQAPFTCG